MPETAVSELSTAGLIAERERLREMIADGVSHPRTLARFADVCGEFPRRSARIVPSWAERVSPTVGGAPCGQPR